MPAPLIVWLSNLHLQQELLAIAEQDVEQGLDMLLTELSFQKKLLINQQLDLISFVISIHHMRVIYHGVDSLLALPQMANHLKLPY